jgi:hypothetical protein
VSGFAPLKRFYATLAIEGGQGTSRLVVSSKCGIRFQDCKRMAVSIACQEGEAMESKGSPEDEMGRGTSVGHALRSGCNMS